MPKKIKIHEMSFSGLYEYLMCPLKFRYSKIDQYVPEFTPVSLAFGSGIHNALEAYYKAIQNGKSPLATPILINIVRNALENPDIRFESDTKDDLIAKAGVMLEKAVAMPAGDIIGTEVPVEIDITEDFKVIGRIDLLTKESGDVIITDFKTACKKPSEKDVDSNAQLTTYSNVYPDAKLRIRAITKAKSPDCIDYFTQRTDAQRERLRKTFVAVKDCIEANSFYPCEGWQCGNCQYQERCQKDF